jgi:hypothetical protein
MKKPTPEQFNIAAAWLLQNEGEGEESRACYTVATWLDNLRSQDHIRKAAREAGLPAAEVRRKLKELGY